MRTHRYLRPLRHVFYLLFFFFSFCALADTGNELKLDSVTIGFVPSRAGHHSGEPSVVHVAKVLSHRKNADIERIYKALSRLAAGGLTHNSRKIHAATHYIDAEWQGQRVRLFFDGESGLEKFKDYEKEWKVLHGEISAYLNKVQFQQAIK